VCTGCGAGVPSGSGEGAIACRMRHTARRLTSAALHMSPPKRIVRIVAGSTKRERKEDFEEVEASLLKAV
jgi:hypothetical protein